MSIADYETVSTARSQLGDVFRRAEARTAVTVRRDGELYAVLAAEPLRELLVHSIPSQVTVHRESGEVVALMRDQPFVASGLTVDEAVDDLITVLREYQEDWEDHLSTAPNHAPNWGLVQLVKLSTDDQLREWLEARE